MRLVIVTWLGALTLVILAYHHGYDKGHAVATKTALSTDPVSEQLDIVCAALWVGEQNKKYWNKENAR